MPSHKSAAKRVKQIAKRSIVNRNQVSKVRTAVKSLKKLITAKEKDKACAELRKVESVIRKSVSNGITKKQTASRQISRLSALIKKTFTA
jgi:small subunit ribosomal protein S20